MGSCFSSEGVWYDNCPVSSDLNRWHDDLDFAPYLQRSCWLISVLSLQNPVFDLDCCLIFHLNAPSARRVTLRFALHHWHCLLHCHCLLEWSLVPPPINLVAFSSLHLGRHPTHTWSWVLEIDLLECRAKRPLPRGKSHLPRGGWWKGLLCSRCLGFLPGTYEKSLKYTQSLAKNIEAIPNYCFSESEYKFYVYLCLLLDKRSNR